MDRWCRCFEFVPTWMVKCHADLVGNLICFSLTSQDDDFCWAGQELQYYGGTCMQHLKRGIARVSHIIQVKDVMNH